MGCTGGNNVDVSSLEAADDFGSGLAFNNPDYNGGGLVGTISKGYAGGNHYDLANLQNADGFGRSVVLNAAGIALHDQPPAANY